ncbi:AbrB family transcriptional regulator [Acetobacteraceae bacterium H6797]|nr:AbrB family transcriptional regulator [Acetobacteraceae bacterium H6797]
MGTYGLLRGASPDLRHRPPAVRWLVLLACSAVLSWLLSLLHLPAAVLLGSMLSAIGLSIAGGSVKVPPLLFTMAQGMVGMMIAQTMPPSILPEIMGHWPIFLAGTFSTIGAACLIGWLQTRAGGMPGTTAIWGSLPGGATVMTLMSASYGADMRLVAFMQYLRVLCCALLVMVLAKILSVPSTAPATTADGTNWGPLLLTLAISTGVAWLARKLRVPGGPMLLTMVVGMALHFTETLPITQSPVELACGYALIGWAIGLPFTTEVVRYAARLLPRALGAIFALILCSLGFAVLLMVFANVDPLTAVLATSPGGADSVAIIAASTGVNVPFVLAMQIARFLVVVLIGPTLARGLSRLGAKA